MIGTHRDTICRLLVEIGDGCAQLRDDQRRGLACRHIQADEIWAGVGRKQAHRKEDDNRSRLGDQCTFVALDPELPGRQARWREHISLRNDRSKPLVMRMRLASDALAAYVDAVERAFGARRGLCQEVTFYAPEPAGSGRYSPPKLTERQRIVIAGNPG